MRLPHEHLTAQRMKAPVMRSLNGIQLLNLIGEHGPISRAALAKLSRLSKPTVSSQVETLVEQGWVVELGQGESGAKGGKKPTLIRFNADAGRLFAVEINSADLRIAVGNLEGKILHQASFAMGENRSPEAVLDKIRRRLGPVIEREPCVGLQRAISVASPGRVDVRRGVTLQAGNIFNWGEAPIRAMLEEWFSIPVLVDNDVKMATLGEFHFGVAKGMSDAVVIRLGSGIGSGIVVRGRLWHGRHWAAGEIAHMLLDLDRASEDWSMRGYLESMVAPDRVSQAGHERVVLHLAVAIANMICAYDPSIVVLQGEMLAAVADRLRPLVMRAIPWEVRLEVSQISGDAVLLGTLAAARGLAYEHIARQFDGGRTVAAVGK
jgi:predicted NBD/HSP70 family sugar kinase